MPDRLASRALPLLVVLLRRLPVVLLGAAGVLLPYADHAGELGLPDFPWSWLLQIGGAVPRGTSPCTRQNP